MAHLFYSIAYASSESKMTPISLSVTWEMRSKGEKLPLGHWAMVIDALLHLQLEEAGQALPSTFAKA